MANASRVYPDAEWFREQIERRYESLRKFSKVFFGKKGKPFDVSAVSLMIRGKRKMYLEEILQMSKLLNVSFMEIVRHLIKIEE